MSNHFTFRCAHCLTDLDVKEDWIGQTFLCPTCGKTIRVQKQMRKAQIIRTFAAPIYFEQPSVFYEEPKERMPLQMAMQMQPAYEEPDEQQEEQDPFDFSFHLKITLFGYTLNFNIK